MFRVNGNNISGDYWGAGASIAISADDPGTGTSPDYTTSTTTDGSGNFNTNMGIIAKPGFVFSVTDGSTTKTHTVISIHDVTFDVDADTVSGFGAPNSTISVALSNPGVPQDVRRTVPTNALGGWSADFSVAVGANPWELAADVKVTSWANMWQADADFDETHAYAAPPNPQFAAQPLIDSVHGWADWVPGGTATISIDDPGTPENPDFQTTAPISGLGQFATNFSGQFDLMPGHEVTVTDGDFTKNTTVTGLQVTGINESADTVSGIADPNAWVGVSVNGNPGRNRTVQADGDGNWAADFSVAVGSEPWQQAIDIAPGSNGSANQQDDDYDQTQVDWNVPDPRFIGEVRGDVIMGWQWTSNATLLVLVNDPATPQNPDFSDNINADWSGNFDYQLQGVVDLKEGDILTVTDGEIAKQLVLTSLAVTAVDPDADTVSGTAAPGSHVRVWANLMNGPSREVTASGSGEWLADFSVVGGGGAMPQDQPADLVQGTNGCAAQTDPDHDETWYSWRVLHPAFGVVYDHEEIFGGDFLPNALVTVHIDDPGTPANPDYAFGVMSDANGNFGTGFEGAFDLHPDHIVTVSDGSRVKTHTVVALAVTGVDPDGDTVWGTAPPGTTVNVQCWAPDGPNRDVVADAEGNWMANFSIASGSLPWQQPFDIQPGQGGEAVANDTDSDSTHDRWHARAPMFGVDPDNEEMWGGDWEPNAPIGITVDDPGTPENPDFDTETFTDEWGNFGTSLGGQFDIQPGFDVRVSDSSKQKQHYVQHITVESIDPDADTVSGTAPPTCYVWVSLQAENGPARRVLTDGTGHWVADFSVAVGPEPSEQPFDIQLGQDGEVAVSDDDGDWTRCMFRLASPALAVTPASDDLWGWDWQPGSTISITIDDPGTPESPDLVDSFPASDWGDWGTNYSGWYDLKPGDFIVVTDGVATKAHTVTALEITGVDPDADTVFGTAEPLSWVSVNAYSEQGSQRDVQADVNGAWIADFSVAVGEEPWQQATDLTKGMDGDAGQPDDDGDSTQANWHIANPSIGAQPSTDDVWGWDWTAGADVTVTIDDPGTPASPDYETVMPVDEWGNFGSWVEYDVKAGDVVTASDGTVTKDTVVTALVISGVDPDTDTVFGTAEPDSWVNVQVWDDWGSTRDVQADSEGNWIADYSVAIGPNDWEQPVDIAPGSEGAANQWESSWTDDNDVTQESWRIANPAIGVEPSMDNVWGWDWTPGADVTVTIDDPGTPASPDYETAMPVDEWSSFGNWVDFDIKAGDVVTASDGAVTKDTVLTALVIGGVDPDTDTVFGAAEPGSWVNVSVWDDWGSSREVQADGDGTWIADFSVAIGPNEWEQAVDIGPGSEGTANQWDDDNDTTQESWRVANPGIAAQPTYDVIEGWDWVRSGTVTVTVDDPVTPAAPDLTTTLETDEMGNFWLDGPNYEMAIDAGFVITVTDGESAKMHVVTDLVVTDVNADADTVSGVAEPFSGVLVRVWADFSEDGERFVFADAEGNWVADFTEAVGPEGWARGFDLVTGSSGDAEQGDEDGDLTKQDWWVPAPMFRVDPRWDEVSGQDWEPNSYINITIDDPSTPDPQDWFANAQCSPWGDFVAPLANEGIDLHAGFTLTVTDGSTTKAHTLTPLHVTDVDVDADTVSGTGEPGVPVWVETDEAAREVIPAPNGIWVADFSVPQGADAPWDQVYDITPETWGAASQSDADGDQTVTQWTMLNPVFIVKPLDDAIEGSDWAPLTNLTITVERAETSQTPDFVTDVDSDEWGLFRIDAMGFDVLPDDVVTVTDGSATKAHTVTDVAVLGTDADANTVFGTGTVGTALRVWVDADFGGRAVPATIDVHGHWMVDFDDIDYDLVIGDAGIVEQTDTDGDTTSVDWYVGFMPPIAVSDAATMTEDTTLTVAAPGVLGNDENVGAAVIVLLNGPAHGTLNLNTTTGAYTYRPNANYNGSDAFTYALEIGEYTSEPAIVWINITAANHAPVAVNDAYETAEDAALSVDAAAGVGHNDTDVDGHPLTFAKTGNPSHGTLTWFSSDGSFLYTPAANWSGTVTFTYKAFDGSLYSDTATVTITVTAVNDAPTAVNDSASLQQDHALTMPAPGVLGNDSDAEGASLTATLATDVSHGTLALAASGGYTYTPTAGWFGTDTFTYRAYDGAAYSAVATVTFTVTEAPVLPPVVPVAGPTRYDTAIAASVLAYPDGLDPAGAMTVVIATGRNWPDALGGTALAGALDGPVLLTETGAMPAAVAAEVTRLGAEKAIILGGVGAVGNPVETTLKSMLGSANVERIAGATRYQTADLVAARVIAELGAEWDGTGIVATGGNYPDALAVSPLAAARHWPLFLANPVTGLSDATKAVMADSTHILILGGTGAVSPAIETYLVATFGAGNVERLFGADRYATAVAVATYGVDHAGLEWNGVAIATGENFPDALAGGVLQGKRGSVMLLTRVGQLSPATRDCLILHASEIDSVTYLGGTGAVAQNVRDEVAAILE